jgi:fatty acid desaturase
MNDPQLACLAIIALGLLALTVPWPMQLLYVLWAIPAWYVLDFTEDEDSTDE